jgi:hypothetical protein
MLVIHRTESWLADLLGRSSFGISGEHKAYRMCPGRAQTYQKPATSQVVDTGLVAFLFLLPEGEVLFEKLNDTLGVTEVVLLELINLVKGALEGVISQLTGLGVILKHLIVENREVQSETELNWVACGQVNLVSLLVSFLGRVLYLLKTVIFCVLSNVAIVVTDHLDEEGAGFVSAALLINHLLVDDSDNFLAVSFELILDLFLVLEKRIVELGVLGVLLDGGDCAASGAFRRDQVLESHRQEVSFVGVHSTMLLHEDFLEEIDHVFEALSLLSDTSEENHFFDFANHLGVCKKKLEI